MTEASTFRTGILAVALLAPALMLLPATTAEASCSTENRVDHRDAECLSAWWENRGLLKKSPYQVRNMCPGYGKVVAKVDLKTARDRTLTLDDGLPRDGDTRHRIRDISCCSDIGELCNRSDVVTDAGCVARFWRVSPAGGRCGSVTATAVISGGNYECRISATCMLDGTMFLDRPSSITVPWLDLDEVRNCNGRLRRGPCPRPQPDASWLSVSDASAEEAEGASLDFAVTLSQTLSETVTVSYRTSDGTARAGSDYRATSGWLYFGPGQTEKTVSVPVLDDELDEGSETLTLTVWNLSPQHMSVADPIGTGTIVNTDRMPTAWIARFGRTVAEQVLDTVDARMRAKPAPGAEARLAGQRIGLGPLPGAQSATRDVADRLNAGADPARQGFASRLRSPGYGQTVAERDLLPGSSFSLTAETDGKGFVSIWGRGAVTRFSSRARAPSRTGDDLSVDGEVASGLLGADWTRGRWTTGLLVSHSQGDGGYRGAGGPGSRSGTGGRATSTLTGVWPWIRHAVSERLSVWGVAGYGEGSLTLDPEDADGARTGTIRTGLDLTMAAVGLRGVLVRPPETGGIELAIRTDAMGVRTRSAAVGGSSGHLAAATAETTRLRLGLEGSRPFRLAGLGRGTLTLKPGKGTRIETDMALAMGAVGLRGVLVEAPAEGGMEVAAKTDGMTVRTSSDAASVTGGKIAAAEADVTRLRLGLQATWHGMETGGGTLLMPSVEIGVRHDGGDAETGFGADIGAGLAWADPGSGLSADIRGRALLAHEADGFRERGFSAALGWDPEPATALGPSLTLTQTVGAASSGGADALLGRRTMEGLAADDGGGLENRRLEAKLGYGLALFGGRYTGTPELGLGLSDAHRDYSLGWRMGLARSGRVSFELGLTATRREAANEDRAPEHAIGLRGTARW